MTAKKRVKPPKKTKAAPKKMRAPRIATPPGPVPEDLAEGSLADTHERFAQEYLVDLNATAAYQRAYPDASAESARRAGSRLLTNVDVQARIAALMAERSQRTQIKADRVLLEVARVAFSDLGTFATWGPEGVLLVDSTSLSADDRRCIAEVAEKKNKFGTAVRFKLHDKPGALTLLMRHLGLLTDKVQVTGRDGQPLIPVEAIQDAIRRATSNG